MECPAGQNLHQVALQSRLEPHWLRADAGSALVTVRGGRILGIFLADVDHNLLWTSAALRDAPSARAFVGRGEWNVGGDRAWLAPEIELHFLDARNPTYERYAVPAAIDPGAWRLDAAGAETVRLSLRGSARNTASGRTFDFSVRRTVSLCPAPAAVRGLSCFGYEVASRLEIEQPDELRASYGLWQLMQLPAGGAVHVATRRAAELVDYFRTGVAGHALVHAARVEFPVTGRALHKLGLRAADVTGRMAYLRPIDADRATLIVREAAVEPDRAYADYPAHDRGRRDVALQFFNDGGEFGGFGEMEYHAPALPPAAHAACDDECRTWCFAGPQARIRAVAAELLGVAEWP